MTPCLTLREGRADLDAQCLVCSYLVRACRQAMGRDRAVRLYRLESDDAGDPGGAGGPGREAVRVLVYRSPLAGACAGSRRVAGFV